MPITTTIARHYAWRCLLIALVCLVFGVWGIYDYLWTIPARQRHVERGEVCRLVKDTLEPDGWEENYEDARAALDEQIEQLQAEHFGGIEDDAAALADLDQRGIEAVEDRFKAAIESIREQNEEDWFAALVLFQQALAAGPPRTYPLEGVQLLAHDVADKGAQAVANVRPPRVYDRPTQWVFIASLPFAPLYFWFYFSTKRRTYRLDEDGTLHLPEGTWSVDEIADIDMSRWMKKSIAHVEHADGTRVKLDDYKHRDLHLIIGAIASRLYPEEWDAEAKPKKKQPEPGPEQADAAATEG